MAVHRVAGGAQKLKAVTFVETHSHIYGEEFAADRDAVVQRAVAAGAEKIFLPNENAASLGPVLELCAAWPGLCFPMIGLHPEEINDDSDDVLDAMESRLEAPNGFVAVGEVGIDLHFRSDNKARQTEVFCRQTEWARRFSLPLMIHSRDAAPELVAALGENGGMQLSGVFHCFSGSDAEAEAFLRFPGFALGVGGIVTFRKSTLPEVLRRTVPLQRIVLETDSPYMAPVPMRGKRNEPSFIPYIAAKLAEIYGTTVDEVYRVTTLTARSIFPKAWS